MSIPLPPLTGYRRADGRLGVRNLLVAMAAADNANPILAHIRRRNPDVVILPAAYGRGQLGADLEITLRSMAGLAAHPNVGGCLIVAFEPASAERIAVRAPDRAGDLRCLSFLEAGGLGPCLEQADAALAELRAVAAQARRVPMTPGDLVLGLECGGSDTTSGLYGNPALGRLSDALHAAGATLVFSEPVECLGGEVALESRARTPQAAADLRRAIDGFERIARDAGVDLTGINPTADNIAGGLTTIEEKSLGAIAKSGTAPIEGCIGYGVAPPGPGLWLMDAPAAAVENLTALAAGGCQVAGFVTGSGNPIGHTIMPTLKISANSDTVQRMPDHLDVGLADAFAAGAPLDAAAALIAEGLARVVNGGDTAAERLEYLHSNISRFGLSV